MNETPIDIRIEALLFFKGEPVEIKKIVELTEETEEVVRAGLTTLEEKLADRGLTLVFEGEKVMLGTAPEVSTLIEKVVKEEIARDLGKAGLETLAIILYKQKVSRREIDYIRGVNSSFIIRNLLIRGLVERVENEKGDRSFSYKPTAELFAFMGISRAEELPEYETMVAEIESFTKKEEEAEQIFDNE